MPMKTAADAVNLAPQLVLTTWCRVFPTRRPDTADVSATSCDVGFFFSVSYVVSLPNCRHVVVVTTTTYHTHPVRSNFAIRKLVLIYIHKKETKLNAPAARQFCLAPSVTFSFLSPSLWRHTKNAYFSLGWVLYSTKWEKSTRAQHKTQPHNTQQST